MSKSVGSYRPYKNICIRILIATEQYFREEDIYDLDLLNSEIIKRDKNDVSKPDF